jgi:membrane protease YdiL (CAAX protease family)
MPEQEPIQENSKNFLWKVIEFLGVIFRSFGLYIFGASIVLVIFSFITKDSNSKFWLLLIQGLSQLLGFIIFPYIYVKYFNRSLLPKFQVTPFSQKTFGLFIIGILILLSSIPFISWLQDWNKSIDLPSFFDSLEKSMQATENKAKILTEKLIYYNNIPGFLLTLLVIAVLPAAGEEFLFRGITQNEFISVVKNHHVAIWLTGFLFSLLHFQFYGFFPRMLLGVTFGYLYFWSGNIIIPMFVHFSNNALLLVAMNLHKQKVIPIDPESAESLPPITIIISLLVFIFLLFTFKKYNDTGKLYNSY